MSTKTTITHDGYDGLGGVFLKDDKGNGYVVQEDEMIEMVKQYCDGFCPLCFRAIAANDKLCCDCTNEVYEQHKLNCQCEIGR